MWLHILLVICAFIQYNPLQNALIFIARMSNVLFNWQQRSSTCKYAVNCRGKPIIIQIVLLCHNERGGQFAVLL